MTEPTKGAVGLTGFPTPDNPADIEAYLLFYFPDPLWAQYVLGACKTLQYPYNWFESGEMSVDDAAEAFRMIVDEAPYNLLDPTVPTPFWDEDSADDSGDEIEKADQPWYGEIVIVDDELTFVENAFIYVVAGFIAYAGQIGAAISFVPIARKFVVTMKSNPLGGIVRFLADAVEIGRADTYSAADGVVSTPLVMPEPSMSLLAEDVTYPTLWVELLEDNPHSLESVSMTLIRSRLSEADFSNPSQRYNADTDTFQYTPDNGANWYDSPEADPRHSSIFRLPPLETSDPRCDAAANMVKWIKDFIDSVIEQLNADAQALALTNDFLTRFATLFPPALLLLLFQEFATSLFDTGATAIDAVFTPAQYDLLLCAFDCHIELDGTVTASDLTDIEVQIAATMDGVAAAIVDEILFIQGEVGLSNAGAIGSETGDCSECECAWCHTWELSGGSHDDLTILVNFGHISSNGLESSLYEGASSVINAVISFPPVVLDTLTIDYHTGNDGSGGSRTWAIKNGTTPLRSGAFNGGTGEFSMSQTAINVETDRIAVTLDSNGHTQPNWFSTLTLTGTGSNPFSPDNC